MHYALLYYKICAVLIPLIEAKRTLAGVKISCDNSNSAHMLTAVARLDFPFFPFFFVSNVLLLFLFYFFFLLISCHAAHLRSGFISPIRKSGLNSRKRQKRPKFKSAFAFVS